MKLKLSLGQNYELLQKGLKKAPDVIDKAVSEGLAESAQESAQEVSAAISGGGWLQSRSGDLAAAITSYADPADSHVQFIGIGDKRFTAARQVKSYGWLMTDQQKTIKPASANFLAIPSGTNYDGSFFKHPRDVPDGFFPKKLSKAGNIIFGDSQGGKFRLLFTMVKEVLVQGSGVLYDVVLAREGKMIVTIQRAIRQGLNQIGFK